VCSTWHVLKAYILLTNGYCNSSFRVNVNLWHTKNLIKQSKSVHNSKFEVNCLFIVFIRPSICLSGLLAASSRTIQLHTFNHHNERKNCIVFQGQRSRSLHYLVVKHCRQYINWTLRSRTIQLATLDHHHERKNPIDFQGQRSKYYTVENTLWAR
jgi:hypothetical protein